jgi:hypothetical protein
MLTAPFNKGLSSRRLLFRLAATGVAGLCAAASIGCGRPFNVKTQPGLPPANYTAKTRVDGIAIEARTITDEDFLYETFDANLILAGVLPVRVMLTNSGGEEVDCKKARFEIETQSKHYKRVDARKAFKRLISYYGISAYSKAGYKESLEAFSSYEFNVDTALGGTESRQGLMFFLMPAGVSRRPGLTLTVARLHLKSRNAEVSLILN